MDILPNTEKIYADFIFFGEKIIKMYFLKQYDNKNVFIDIGIIYPEIILKADSSDIFLKNKKYLEEYIKILSLQEAKTPDLEKFLKKPSFFGNYIFLIEKEENVYQILEKIFSNDKNFSLYLYNKNLNELEIFTKYFSKKTKDKIRVIDAVNIISAIQYNQFSNAKTRLNFLKDSVSGKM